MFVFFMMMNKDLQERVGLPTLSIVKGHFEDCKC